MSAPNPAMPVVFIPALLCDEQLYRDVIAALGEAIVPQVLLSRATGQHGTWTSPRVRSNKRSTE